MKIKKCRAMNAKKIGKIKTLLDAGFSSREIAETIDVGESTANRYATILEAVHKGQSIPFPTDVYNRKAVEEYCDEHGIECIPVLTDEDGASEQPKPAVDPIVNALYDYSVVMEHIAEAMHALSKSLGTIYAAMAEGESE